MSEFTINIAAAAIAFFLLAVPTTLYCIFLELRAIRKMLQARWDYDRFCLLQDVRKSQSIPSKDKLAVTTDKFLHELLQKPHELGDMPPVPCPRRHEPEVQDFQP